MTLGQLKAPKGANRARKRVGRGQGSGLGKTAGRGAKGQKARSGNMHFEGFEGGQMPLQRRLPKFGFNNVFRREFDEVQVSRLGSLPVGVIDQALLFASGLVRRTAEGVVVLGQGELSGAYTVRADRVTAGARAAIEKAGGTVELVPRPQTMHQKAKAAKRAANEADPQRAAKKAAKAAQAAARAEAKAAKPEKAPKGDAPEKVAKPPKAEKAPKAKGGAEKKGE